MYQFKIDNIILRSLEGDIPIEPKKINIIAKTSPKHKNRR